MTGILCTYYLVQFSPDLNVLSFFLLSYWSERDHNFARQQSQQRQQNSEVAKAIAQDLWASVVKWNAEFTPSGVRGTVRYTWKKILKNNFVYVTRLQDPWQQRKDWKADISIAVNKTVAKLCPNRVSDDKERAMCNLIFNFAKRMKTSPRRDWLSQKAYAWLKWSTLHPPQNAPWYPAFAILVSYELFLSGSGKFESFMKILKKNSNQPQIKQLIIAHESMETMGSC